MACPPLCGPSQRHIEIEAQFQKALTTQDRVVLGVGILAATGAGFSVMAGTASLMTSAAPVAAAAGPAFSKLEVQQLRDFFGGSGAALQGALDRAKNFKIPDGLSVETLRKYGDVAQRAIDAGKDKTGVQAERLKLVNRAIEELTDQ
jgi:hypothetical protein